MTADVYRNWVATLTGSDLAAALAAKLDAPPVDETSQFQSRGFQLMEFDGLPTFHKNGAVHPLQHEATRDHTTEEIEDYDIAKDSIVPDLAAALRRVLDFIVRGYGPEDLFLHSKTIAQRLFIVCRAIQIGGCEKPTLAEVAEVVGFTRASLSKCSIEFRDALGNSHLHFGGRGASQRKTMSGATARAWKRRKG